MDRVFRLKRIKTVVQGGKVKVTAYGHAARGREVPLGTFITTRENLKADLEKYLQGEVRLLPPARLYKS